MERIIRTVLVCLLCLGAAAPAAVVRPAPDFGVEGVRNGSALRSFRGQTVVLVIARNARDKRFLAELWRLGEIYGQLASEKVIFVAAILSGPAEVRSDIPFILASDPEKVAADYGVTGPFGIAVIGRDGNLDLNTAHVVPGARVKDMIFNSFDSQEAARRQPVSS